MDVCRPGFALTRMALIVMWRQWRKQGDSAWHLRISEAPLLVDVSASLGSAARAINLKVCHGYAARTAH